MGSFESSLKALSNDISILLEKKLLEQNSGIPMGMSWYRQHQKHNIFRIFLFVGKHKGYTYITTKFHLKMI